VDEKSLCLVLAILTLGSSFSLDFSAGFIDALFHLDTCDIFRRFPNSKPPATVMQLLGAEQACSLIVVDTDYCSADWVELSVWEAAHPSATTGEELAELPYAKRDYDLVPCYRDSWPIVLCPPCAVESDGLGNRTTRWCCSQVELGRTAVLKEGNDEKNTCLSNLPVGCQSSFR
jgi:hypothetical protein